MVYLQPYFEYTNVCQKVCSREQITPLISLGVCVGVKPPIGVLVAPPVVQGARLGEGVSS